MKRMFSMWMTLALLAVPSLEAQQSFRGTYKIAVDVPKQAARGVTEETVWTYRVIDDNDVTVTEVNRSMPFDVAAPQPAIFESGRVLLLHSFDAYGEIFDRTGDLIRRFPLIPDPSPDYERVIRCAVHASVVMVGVAQGEQGIRIISIDEEGNVSNRRTIEALTITGLAVGEDPEALAIGTMTWRDGAPRYETTVLQGPEEWKVSKGFTRGKFVAQDRFVGLSDRSVYLLSLASKSLLWTDELAEGRLLVDADVSDEGVTILSADKPKWFEGGWIYTSPKVRRLTMTGKTVTESDVVKQSFSKGSLERADGRTVVRLDGNVID